MFLKRRVAQFHISEAGPPNSVTSFSTFQANGVGYFLHSEVFEDRQLLSQLVGSFDVFENKTENWCLFYHSQQSDSIIAIV